MSETVPHLAQKLKIAENRDTNLKRNRNQWEQSKARKEAKKSSIEVTDYSHDKKIENLSSAEAVKLDLAKSGIFDTDQNLTLSDSKSHNPDNSEMEDFWISRLRSGSDISEIPLELMTNNFVEKVIRLEKDDYLRSYILDYIFGPHSLNLAFALKQAYKMALDLGILSSYVNIGVIDKIAESKTQKVKKEDGQLLTIQRELNPEELDILTKIFFKDPNIDLFQYGDIQRKMIKNHRDFFDSDEFRQTIADNPELLLNQNLQTILNQSDKLLDKVLSFGDLKTIKVLGKIFEDEDYHSTESITKIKKALAKSELDASRKYLEELGLFEGLSNYFVPIEKLFEIHEDLSDLAQIIIRHFANNLIENGVNDTELTRQIEELSKKLIKSDISIGYLVMEFLKFAPKYKNSSDLVLAAVREFAAVKLRANFATN